MSSINSLGNNPQLIKPSVCSCGGGLSQTTIMRLEALGIDPTTVETEAQAQILIAQAEAAKKQEITGQNQQGGSSQEQLLSEAKNLARAVGVSVSNQDTLSDILSKIADKLNTMVQNPYASEKAEKYQAELANIAQRANITVKTQENIFNSMDMISISNKLLLGL